MATGRGILQGFQKRENGHRPWYYCTLYSSFCGFKLNFILGICFQFDKANERWKGGRGGICVWRGSGKGRGGARCITVILEP